LFRDSERIVGRKGFGGYRANVVTYTIALMSHATLERVDFEKIWREQAISPAMEEAVAVLSQEVHRVIIQGAGSRNVTEWCKNEKCWDSVRGGASREGIHAIQGELIGVDAARRETKRAISELPETYVENLKRLVEVSSESWSTLATWGAQTRALDPAQRQLALSVGRAMRLGRQISPDDAERAVATLDHAKAMGFEVVAA
jgi:hypothetical protein